MATRRRHLAPLAGAAATALLLSLAWPAPSGAYPRPGSTTLVSGPTHGVWQPPVGITLGQCERNNNDVLDVTPNGRFVAFASVAPNLVPSDTNLACDVFRKDLVTGRVIRVSVSSDEREGRVPGVSALNEPPHVSPDSTAPSISADGRYVAFSSWAQDLVGGDTNRRWDVFVRDIRLGVTKRVSVSSTGAQGTSGDITRQPDSGWPSLSSNGRHVAFASSADNLIARDTNGYSDVFVRDLRTRKTIRASIAIEGGQTATGSTEPSISADGRRVAINQADAGRVYVRDLVNGRRYPVAVSSHGEAADNYSAMSDNSGGDQISADGRYVVFESNSGLLVPNDTNGTPPLLSAKDIFVRDLWRKRTERISVTSQGEELEMGSEGGGLAISPDGRYVTFGSRDTALSPSENPESDRDVYVYDRTTGQATWTSVDRAGGDRAHCSTTPPPATGDQAGKVSTPGALSSGGRHALFLSTSSCLVTGDNSHFPVDIFLRNLGQDLGAGGSGGVNGGARTTGDCPLADVCPAGAVTVASADPRGDAVDDQGDLIGARLSYRPDSRDLFGVLDLQRLAPVGRVQDRRVVETLPAQTHLYGMVFRVGDRRYEVRASSVLGGTMALYECTDRSAACEHAATLRGGFGTTGDRVVFSIPVARVRNAHEILHDVEAFAGVGSLVTGPAVVIDVVTVAGRPVS